MSKNRLKKSGELEAEIAKKQIQNKRFHQKVKGSGFTYNRQKAKQILKEYESASKSIHR